MTANQSQQENPKSVSKLFPVEFGYCLVHGYTSVVHLDDNGEHFHNHPSIIEEGRQELTECPGPFIHGEPPPDLTEEEWENIFSMEGTL